MLKIFGMCALALVWAPGHSSAQGVDFRTFDNSHHSFILTTTRPSPTNAAGNEQAATLPLAVEFRELGESKSEVKSRLVDVRSSLPSAPRWMRTKGAAMARSARRDALPTALYYPAAHWTEGTPAGCSQDVYRSKGLKPQIEERRSRYYSLMVATACQVGVPVALFDALITQESGYNPAAISVKGAIGMAQLMPGTARFVGVNNPWNVAENLRGGAQILKTHLAEFGRYDLALAAYNAGAGRVRQKRRVPTIKETANYVSSILSDVRRQYAQAIGFRGIGQTSPMPVRNASLVRF